MIEKNIYNLSRSSLFRSLCYDGKKCIHKKKAKSHNVNSFNFSLLLLQRYRCTNTLYYYYIHCILISMVFLCIIEIENCFMFLMLHIIEACAIIVAIFASRKSKTGLIGPLVSWKRSTSIPRAS